MKRGDYGIDAPLVPLILGACTLVAFALAAISASLSLRFTRASAQLGAVLALSVGEA
jgi:hypothetical protein